MPEWFSSVLSDSNDGNRLNILSPGQYPLAPRGYLITSITEELNFSF